MLYGEYKNKVVENSGITIENPTKQCPAYFFKINMNDAASLDCANIADNLFKDIYKIEDKDIIIVDFSDVKSAGRAFLEKYLMYYLTTEFKIININMNLIVESAWSVVCTEFFESIE